MRLYSAFLLMILFISACKKNDSDDTVASPQPNSAAGSWVQKMSFSQGLTNVFAFSINSKGYVIIDDSSANLWEYDPTIDTWSQKTSFPGLPAYVAFAIGSKGYTMNYNNEFWEYDASINSWSRKADYPAFNSPAIAFVIGNFGYLAAGFNNHELWEWNQTTNSWNQKSDFTAIDRRSLIGFSIGSKGYIGTGTNSTYFNDFWEWNQQNDSWSQKADVPGSIRAHATGFAINQKGYVGLGGTAGNYRNDMYEYDPANNSWRQKNNFPSYGRHWPVSFVIGTKAYVGMGQDSSLRSNTDIWEFDPFH